MKFILSSFIPSVFWSVLDLCFNLRQHASWLISIFIVIGKTHTGVEEYEAMETDGDAGPGPQRC